MKHYEDALLVLVTDYEDGTVEVQEQQLHNKNTTEVEALATKTWRQRHFSDKKRVGPTRWWICDGVARVGGGDGSKIPAKVRKVELGIVKWNAQAVKAWAEGEGPLGPLSHWQNWITEGEDELLLAKSQQTKGNDHETIYISV